jgi:2-oxo-3-hexenedioate decarboxylase
MPDLDAMAATLAAAARDAVAVPQLSASAEYSLDDAYAIQRKVVSLRPGPRIGMKMGFTSRAKMAQMGVDDLICGELTADMRIMDGGEISLDQFVHPRAEPEIAYLLGAPLSGPVSPAEAMLAVDAVAVAVEIIDSRYRDFAFSLEDVVADNASSSGFVIGDLSAPASDVANIGMTLSFNGRPVLLGTSAAILGNPARALAEASRLAAEKGIALEAGSIVLAGAATAAEALRPGLDVTVTAAGLGSASFTTRAAWCRS